MWYLPNSFLYSMKQKKNLMVLEWNSTNKMFFYLKDNCQKKKKPLHYSMYTNFAAAIGVKGLMAIYL